MKKYVSMLALMALVLVLASCTKEDPLPVSASFTTNIQGDLETGESFMIYTSEATGEFLAYFKGDSEDTSWETGFGSPFDAGIDSLSIGGYSAAGTYSFTLVATSYGNWGETTEQDVQTLDITVVARD